MEERKEDKEGGRSGKGRGGACKEGRGYVATKVFSSSLDPRLTPGHCDQTLQGILHLTSYNPTGFGSPTDLISSAERAARRRHLYTHEPVQTSLRPKSRTWRYVLSCSLLATREEHPNVAYPSFLAGDVVATRAMASHNGVESATDCASMVGPKPS